MRNRFNRSLFLWGLGVIQPATFREVFAFLRLLYPEVKHWPTGEELKKLEENLLNLNYIFPSHKGLGLYALTLHANQNLDVKIRRSRDKARITLLNATYGATLKKSEEVEQDLDGVAPSSEASSIIQEDARPISSTASPSFISRSTGRTYWPRIVEQLNLEVGLESHPSDSFFKYYSFPNLNTVHLASESRLLKQDISLTELGLCIGITPRLLSSFIHKPSNHYRTFAIAKKGGGERQISSPRFFLKTVQYWLKSYFLVYLKVHPSCHAYEKNRSIRSNAEVHVGRSFVANIDIEDYFGSITQDGVYRLLVGHNFGPKLASSISKLVTLDGSIPQGAPTSPVISNSYLFAVDDELTREAEARGLKYTRYADDITISGDSREPIIELIRLCAGRLKEYRLRLNNKKTRIASRYGSQRVTGVVVNEKTQPPREYQRRVRALFHNAECNPIEYAKNLGELRGHLSYLSSFDVLKDSRHLRRYRMVIEKLEAAENKE